MAISRSVAKVYEKLVLNWRLANIVLAGALLGVLVLGVYLRFAPFYINGFEFYEFDSYIEYWQAKYVYEHGLLSWYTLTQQNPDTHIFWYPYGRDFIYTSYPFFPMWIATTYHLASVFGIGFREWAIIQPLIFAGIGILISYLVGKELTGSKIGGIVSALMLAVLPAARERTVIGYIEKEGAAVVFLYLFIYFYLKLLKSIGISEGRIKSTIYLILTALSMALVGWLWGGYTFIIGVYLAHLLISPLLVEKLDKKTVMYTWLIIPLSLLFVLPSPSIAKTMGFIPLSLKGLGWPIIAVSLIYPAYYYLAEWYREIGLRRPLLNKRRYFVLLLIGIVGGAVAVVAGVLPIGGRLAWALGFRGVEVVDPLVESIAEHQSPLSTYGSFMNMLYSWGVFEWLFFTSPLVLGVVGSLYMLVKGRLDTLLAATGFLLGFYSYLNASYMIAVAAYFGVLVMGYIATRLISYATPSIAELQERKKGVVRAVSRKPYRGVAVAIVILALINLGYTGYLDYQISTTQVYTFKAGVSGLALFSDSWYKAMELLRNNTPNDSVVIAWWDYGYGITVVGERASVADGSTWNGTQIGIIGLIMSSRDTAEAARLASLFRVQPNKTFIMAIDGFWIDIGEKEVNIWPYYRATPNVVEMPGIVDIPKSVWMIKIGNYTVTTLTSNGINVSYVDVSKILYLYTQTDYTQRVTYYILSPNFLASNTTGLIYRLLVDGVLYWCETQNKTGKFWWFTGSEGGVQKVFGWNVKELTVNDKTYTSERPLADDPYFKPYAVIVEPFINPKTGEKVYYPGLGTLYSVIVIYQLVNIPG